MTTARYILLLCVVVLFAILGVAQRTSAIHLGYHLESLQEEYFTLADQNRQLLCDIGALSHPARIAGEIERSDIILLDPVTLTQFPATGESAGRLHGNLRTGP